MDFYLHIIVLIGGILPSILGFNLVFGKGKILHFGGLGVSVAIGYMLVLALKATGSYPLAILIAVLGGSVMSLFFAWLSLRLEPDGLGVMSIAVHLAALAVVLNWNSVTRGALGIPRIPRMWFLNSVPDFAVLAVLTIIASVVVFWLIDRSTFGRQIAALAEHEWHAKSLGINRTKVHIIAFLILGVAQVVSNVVYLQYLTLLHPNDYQFPALVFWVMVAVAGRPGSIWGVTISTFLLMSLKEALRFVALPAAILGPVRLMLFGLILFIAVYIRRDTLFPKQRSI